MFRLMSEPESKHILGTFESALQGLRNNVLMMASLTERNFNNASNGLFQRDDDLCNIAIADDEEIDHLEMQIDRDGVDVLLRYQPLASDLRQVVSSMKLSVNIERIADQAVNIGRRGRKLNARPELSEIHALQPLHQLTQSMYKDAVRAYADRSVDLALTLKARDKELDEMNRQFAERCTERMAQDAANIAGYLNLIFIARFLERIGDHATNMAEDTVYAVEAADIRHSQPAPPETAP
jgi:phosphate transport system protein